MNILEIFKKSAVCSGMKRKRGCHTKRLLPEMSFRACREIPEGNSHCLGDSGTRHGCCYPKQVLDNTSSISVGMTAAANPAATAPAAVRQRQGNIANGARKGLRYGGYLVGSIVVGSWRFLSFRACREIPEIYINQGDSSTRHGCCYPKQVLDNTSSASVGMT